ncbi:MAG: shikimate dehydrogenase [Victivallales bacterium]|nr:shikimate dehydrogenase [Victivallales bacterium]
MLKFAVIGYPVKHSKSPAMQLAGFQALGIEATYEKVEVAPGELPAVVRHFVDKDYRGWNITVPYKEEIIPLVEVVGEEARAAHSVNTVVNRDGRLLGYSTDGYGVEQALRHDFGLTAQPAHQVFLGAGGAARAAAVYAARHGARQITLANRTAANAERIAALVKAAAPECEVVVTSPTDNLLRQMLRNAELVLQCTSLGLHEGDALPVPPEWIPVNTPVFDFVYTPSQFKERLVAQGNRVSNGLEMLLQQGCKSFELWTGQPAPVEAMRQALYQNEE